MERLRAMALADRVSSIPATERLSMVSLAGVPVLPMPEHVVVAAAEAARHPRPRESRGTPGLRAAVAAYLSCTQGLVVDPERELLVTHGAQHGMSVALRSVLHDDSQAGKSGGTPEVLVPCPTYFFDGTIRLAGARPVYVSTRAADGWAIDPVALDAAVTPATRAIVLCNPNNPTGSTPAVELLRQILQVAERYGLTVLSDESYARYVHDGPGYTPVMSLVRQYPQLVTVTSLSKDFAFTNWRVGYIHAPAAMVDRAQRALEWDAINVGDVAQAAAQAVLDGPKDWLDAVFAAFRGNRDVLVRKLRDRGFSVVCPPAGIFAFADLGPIGSRGAALEELLLRAGIMALAGDAFHGPTDHARLLYGGPEDGLIDLVTRLSSLRERAASA